MTRGEKIRELREKLGMTQTELAEKIGVSKSMVSAYENDIRKPSFSVLESLSEALGVHFGHFFERGYLPHETVTVNITDLKPEQQKIIFSLVNEFRKSNQEKE